MYNKRIASQQCYPADTDGGDVSQTLVGLFYALSTSFAVNPDVYYDKRGRIVRAFYAYTLLDCDDLFEAYSAPLARLSRLADFAVCGATEARESAVLTCRPNADAGQVACTKYNASGRNFTQLSNVCVTIRGADEAICAGLKALLSSMDFRQEYLAIGRGGWLEAQLAPLGQVSDDTFYRYIALRAQAPKGDFLKSLHIPQQKELWRAYLHDGVSPLEFAYVMEELARKRHYNLFRWELALYMALEQEGYQLREDACGLRIYDAAGARLRLDYAAGSPAEKLLLKMLYPASPARR